MNLKKKKSKFIIADPREIISRKKKKIIFSVVNFV